MAKRKRYQSKGGSKLKIQNVAISTQGRKHDMRAFLLAMRDMKVGQSFVVPSLPAHYRLVMAAMPVLMGRKLISRKEKNGYRVGRIM